MPLLTKICKMFQPMRYLECTFIILLSAGLDNMSLDIFIVTNERQTHPLTKHTKVIQQSYPGFETYLWFDFIFPLQITI